MSALQGVLTSPRINRWLPWVAGTVLVAGVITFLAVKYTNTATSTETPVSNKPAQTAVSGKRVPLAPGVRRVAAEFIQKAVPRLDAAAAYRLSGPDIRQGQTLAQWTRDWNDPNVGVPIVPFHPTKNAAMSIDYSVKGEAQLEFMLTPKPNAPETKPQLFTMVVDFIPGQGWKVNYWGSNSKPPVRGVDTK